MSNLFRKDREYYEPSSRTLRATGNLTYLEFIRLLTRLWSQAHPSFPILPQGSDELAQYPCIVYHLELRKVHPSEPKLRDREFRYQGDRVEQITGQRFQNVVAFSAMTEGDPDVAEALIEAFEDFMLEYTGVFKELGLSELMYGRRMPDKMESRQGVRVVMRSVAYMVTTEKQVVTEHEKLREITILAKAMKESDQAIIVSGDRGTIYDSSPRYFLSGDQDHLRFSITQEEIDAAPSPEQVAVFIPKTNLRIGDRVFLVPDIPATPSGNELEVGFYLIKEIVNYNPYSTNMGYVIERWRDGATPSSESVSISDVQEGSVFYIPELLHSSLIDRGE